MFGVARSQQPRKRIVKEVAILSSLLDFDQIVGRAVSVIRRVIHSVGVFNDLFQSAQSIGFAAPSFVGRIADCGFGAAVHGRDFCAVRSFDFGDSPQSIELRFRPFQRSSGKIRVGSFPGSAQLIERGLLLAPLRAAFKVPSLPRAPQRIEMRFVFQPDGRALFGFAENIQLFN